MSRWTPGSPAVVRIPSLGYYEQSRVYRDAADPGHIHVDALEARVVRRAARSADASSLRRPARPVHLSFSPDGSVLEGARSLVGDERGAAMAWNTGPFFAWVRRAGGVTLIDHGHTSRGREHEARIEGSQPPGVELAQAMAAAELLHYARLEGLTIRARGDASVASEIRELARVGRRAAWTATLADALGAALVDLLRRDRLEVTVASAAVPLRAFDEVRDLVVMEWAHRLAGDQALSLPAAGLSGLIHDRQVDLSIDWRDGDRVPLRVVRSVRYESMAADSPRTLARGLSGRVRRRAVAAL